MQPWRSDVRLVRDNRDQLVERRHLTAREDVGLAGGLWHRPAEPEAFHEIVDVGEVVVDAAAAQHDEAPPRHAAEQFQQAAIARAVNPRWSGNDDVDAGRGSGVSRNPLPFQLGLLIDVPGTERRVFCRRRMLDIAVNADRAAVHDPPHAARGGSLDHVPDGGRVDGAIFLVAQPRLSVNGGDVEDDLDAGARRPQCFRIANVASSNLDVPLLEIRRSRSVAHQRANRMPLRRERTGKMSTGEAGGAGD